MSASGKTMSDIAEEYLIREFGTVDVLKKQADKAEFFNHQMKHNPKLMLCLLWGYFKHNKTLQKKNNNFINP